MNNKIVNEMKNILKESLKKCPKNDLVNDLKVLNESKEKNMLQRATILAIEEILNGT